MDWTKSEGKGRHHSLPEVTEALLNLKVSNGRHVVGAALAHAFARAQRPEPPPCVVRVHWAAARGCNTSTRGGLAASQQLWCKHRDPNGTKRSIHWQLGKLLHVRAVSERTATARPLASRLASARAAGRAHPHAHRDLSPAPHPPLAGARGGATLGGSRRRTALARVCASAPPPAMAPQGSIAEVVEGKEFNFASEEHKILAFWDEIQAFETQLKNTEGQKEFIFYDGPPFATGLPHYGHILAGTIKVRGRAAARGGGVGARGGAAPQAAAAPGGGIFASPQTHLV